MIGQLIWRMHHVVGLRIALNVLAFNLIFANKKTVFNSTCSQTSQAIRRFAYSKSNWKVFPVEPRCQHVTHMWFRHLNTYIYIYEYAKWVNLFCCTIFIAPADDQLFSFESKRHSLLFHNRKKVKSPAIFAFPLIHLERMRVKICVYYKSQ